MLSIEYLKQCDDGSYRYEPLFDKESEIETMLAKDVGIMGKYHANSKCIKWVDITNQSKGKNPFLCPCSFIGNDISQYKGTYSQKEILTMNSSAAVGQFFEHLTYLSTYKKFSAILMQVDTDDFKQYRDFYMSLFPSNTFLLFQGLSMLYPKLFKASLKDYSILNGKRADLKDLQVQKRITDGILSSLFSNKRMGDTEISRLNCLFKENGMGFNLKSCLVGIDPDLSVEILVGNADEVLSKVSNKTYTYPGYFKFKVSDEPYRSEEFEGIVHYYEYTDLLLMKDDEDFKIFDFLRTVLEKYCGQKQIPLGYLRIIV